MSIQEVKEIADKLSDDSELWSCAEYLYQHIVDKGYCPKCLGKLTVVSHDEDVYLKCTQCGMIME